MISQNPYSNCTSARLYYYDFLSEEGQESIPESTLNHIIDCLDCQAEIGRLESLLMDVDQKIEDQHGRRLSAITTLLKFHFAYVEEPVTCGTIKPFLASLADPVLQVLIPTPITQHIDECQSCRRDLHALQDLHLTHKQLCRLGQLLADEPADDALICSQARAAIPAVASMVFRRTDAEVLKHLSVCPDCRQELIQHRQELRRTLPDSGANQDKIPCQAVSASDIYDYAFPYGINPATDEYAQFREPFASHLGGCPTCLAKIHELQETIYAIAERPESDVVTVYHVDDPVAPKAKPRPSRIIRFRRVLASPSVKPWLKVGVAAAIVLAAWILIPSATTVEALSFDQMSRALEKARNIHVLFFAPDKAEPTRERWVSRSLQVFLSKDEKGFFLSDFANGFQKERLLGGDAVVNDLPDDAPTVVERNMQFYLGILPPNLFEESRDSHWIRVLQIQLGQADEKEEVYDLTWTEKSYGGSPRCYRRRYFVDLETSFPKRIELCMKRSVDDGEYELVSKIFVKQISDDEMKAAIKNTFP